MRCYRHIPDIQWVRDAKAYVEEHNLGQRGVFDGNKTSQTFGLIAQMIVRNVIGLPRIEENHGFDGGYDLEHNGLKIDVKCVVRNNNPKLYYACNVPEPQMRYDNDAYIFVSFNKQDGEYSVVGWITKEDFKKKASYTPKGGKRTRADGTLLEVTEVGLYEVPIKALHRIKNETNIRNIK